MHAWIKFFKDSCLWFFFGFSSSLAFFTACVLVLDDRNVWNKIANFFVSIWLNLSFHLQPQLQAEVKDNLKSSKRQKTANLVFCGHTLLPFDGRNCLSFIKCNALKLSFKNRNSELKLASNFWFRCQRQVYVARSASSFRKNFIFEQGFSMSGHFSKELHFVCNIA